MKVAEARIQSTGRERDWAQADEGIPYSLRRWGKKTNIFESLHLPVSLVDYVNHLIFTAICFMYEVLLPYQLGN